MIPEIKLRDGRIEGVHGHQNERENTCFGCGGELRASDGHFHSRMAEISLTKAFSAALCCACAGHKR